VDHQVGVAAHRGFTVKAAGLFSPQPSLAARSSARRHGHQHKASAVVTSQECTTSFEIFTGAENNESALRLSLVISQRRTS